MQQQCFLGIPKDTDISCFCMKKQEFTLYQVSGCLLARSEPCTHSTEELPLIVLRLKDSPFKPTCEQTSTHSMVLVLVFFIVGIHCTTESYKILNLNEEIKTL